MTAALVTVILLNGVRTEKPPPSCQVWRESLALPLRPFRIFRAPARAPALLAIPVVVLATGVGLAHFGPGNWTLSVLAVTLVAALLLVADAVYGLVQLYWPKRRIGGATEFEVENLGVSFVATLPIMAFLVLAILVSRILERPGNGGLMATIAAGVALTFSALAWRPSTARQRREIESRTHELLLKDPPH